MLSVRLPTDLQTRLQALSTKTNRTQAFYVKKALEKFLNTQEEIEWATQAYKEHLESGQQVISLEELKKKYQID